MRRSSTVALLTLMALGAPCYSSAYDNDRSSIQDDVSMLQVSLKQGKQSSLKVNSSGTVVRSKSDCVPNSEEACAAAATYYGLLLGGGGSDFVGDYGTKGCYFYIKGTYRRMAFYSPSDSEEELTASVSEPKMRVPGSDCGVCEPYSEEACALACMSQGYAAGSHSNGKDIDFAGDYAQKGCYTYRNGPYRTAWFYGEGGTAAEISFDLGGSGAKKRPVGWGFGPNMKCTGHVAYHSVGGGQCASDRSKAGQDYQSIGWSPCTEAHANTGFGLGGCADVEECQADCTANTECAAIGYYNGNCWLYKKLTGSAYVKTTTNYPFYECFSNGLFIDR